MYIYIYTYIYIFRTQITTHFPRWQSAPRTGRLWCYFSCNVLTKCCREHLFGHINYIYIYIYIYVCIYICMYIHTYTYFGELVIISSGVEQWLFARALVECIDIYHTVDFRNFIVFFGRDPGTLKSDIVSKKHPQLICSDLRLSNWKFEDWNYGNRLCIGIYHMISQVITQHAYLESTAVLDT